LVQGVGFRWYALNQAQRLGVAGWARNRADGSVEVVGLADAAVLGRFEEALRRGPPASLVEAVEVSEVPQQVVESKSFTIKH
jgi:acylphosphatase